MEGIKYNEKGLIVAITQDIYTGKVLMQAFMNEEALKLTLETKIAHYYSRSREKIWKKGETSGNIQKVKGIYFDCDKDAVLLKVEQVGVACHTGKYSCFFNEEIGSEVKGLEMLTDLEEIIEDRKNNPDEDSYTSMLLTKGVDKIGKKMGEEAFEMVIASKNEDKNEIVLEGADLVYHMLVLLKSKGLSILDVCEELNKRHGN